MRWRCTTWLKRLKQGQVTKVLSAAIFRAWDIRNSIFLAGVLIIAGCGYQGPVSLPRQQDRAPTLTPVEEQRLARLPDPQVVTLTKSRWGNGPVYTVLGKSYRVMEQAKGYRQEGIASWYGAKFHGNNTSNGERFDMYQLSAAHRHLPIPSFVRVTNLGNGREAVVRVNDRGPFHENRIIDLSYAAAVKLGFHNQGTARVRIEVVEPAPPAPDFFVVQAGAFSALAGADRGQAEINALTGVKGVIVKTSNDGLYRVRLGPLAAGPDLERVKGILKNSAYGAPRLIPVSRNQVSGKISCTASTTC